MWSLSDDEQTLVAVTGWWLLIVVFSKRLRKSWYQWKAGFVDSNIPDSGQLYFTCMDERGVRRLVSAHDEDSSLPLFNGHVKLFSGSQQSLVHIHDGRLYCNWLSKWWFRGIRPNIAFFYFSSRRTEPVSILQVGCFQHDKVYMKNRKNKSIW